VLAATEPDHPFAIEAIMPTPVPLRSIESDAPNAPLEEAKPTNRRATVRYRYTHPNPSRAFIANSTKSEEAQVIDLSKGGIGFVLSLPVEMGTLIRIELNHADNAPLIDTMAEVVFVAPLENGQWRCGCAWLHALSAEELRYLL
jgi:hypothetical protein